MTERPANTILQALSDEDFHQLSFGLRSYDLDAGTILYEPEDCVDVVWFPVSGSIATQSLTPSGGSVATSIVGLEGAAGLLEACGAGRTFSRSVVQTSGRFHRLPAKAFCDRLDVSSDLLRVVQAYSQTILVEARQLILCYARHRGDKRFAWLLLELQDRLGGNTRLPLTQDDLAEIMSAQRTTVTSFATRMRNEGMIDYRRGLIEILDRRKLENSACSCRATLKKIKRQLNPERLAEARSA